MVRLVGVTPSVPSEDSTQHVSTSGATGYVASLASRGSEVRSTRPQLLSVADMMAGVCTE